MIKTHDTTFNLSQRLRIIKEFKEGACYKAVLECGDEDIANTYQENKLSDYDITNACGHMYERQQALLVLGDIHKAMVEDFGFSDIELDWANESIIHEMVFGCITANEIFNVKNMFIKSFSNEWKAILEMKLSESQRSEVEKLISDCVDLYTKHKI